jgi:flagellar basal-body rod protein FlgB
MPIGNDTTTLALSSALNGLQAEQQAIAANIANVNTPNYTAVDVNFQSALAQALASGSSPVVSPTTVASTAPIVANGNNVDINAQTVQAQKTQLQYQTVVEALTNQYSLIRSAIDQGGA